MKKVVFGFLFLLPILAFAQPVRPLAVATQIDNISDNGMTLHWKDNSNNEIGFRIYWDQGTGVWDMGTPIATVASTTVGTTGTNYSTAISSLSPNTVYNFRVFSYNGGGNSTNPPPGYITMGSTTFDIAPADPIALAVTGNSFTSQTIDWTDLSNNEEGFEIYISTDNFNTTDNFLDQVSFDVTTYTANGLTPGTQYWYRVRAFNSGQLQFSNFSNIANETTLVLLPVELTSFSATGLDNSVNLRWRTESESNNSHFNLYRSIVAGERGELLARIEGHGTAANSNDYSYSDIRVVNGVTYYYQIADVSFDGIETMARFTTNATPAPHALGEIPFKYNLSQNFPNPFNPSTEITYGLHKAGSVRLTVFNELGKEVATLVNGYQAANTYRISFNAASLPSGTYYYTLSTNGFTTTKKMVLTK